MQKEPKAIVIPDEFNSAQSISSGSHHSALVTKGGELYVCGSALHGKLGLPGLSVNNLNKFTKIPLKATIRQVACGDYHTLALSKEGWVYAWGGSLHKKAQGGNEPTIV
jgi:alpha-tubulin suppressor-like RCC1 family protein